METNKTIIIGLVAVIAILLVLIGMTILPNMLKEECNIEITSPESLNDSDNITIKLTDSKNNPIADKNIKISFRNASTQEYTVKTDTDGIATLALSEENDGAYNVTCTFDGDDKYKETSTSKEITIEKSFAQSVQSTNDTQDSIEANRPKNDPNYKGYTPNHESEVINGWDPSQHETYREKMSDGTVKIHYDDDYFRIVDENGYVITYGYGG